MNLTFPKSERLKHRKRIDLLFTKGESILVYPFKIVFSEVEDSESIAQIGISVSKKYSKKAVDRNHIKRLIRESYRINKSILVKTLSEKNKKLVFMFIWVGKTKPEYAYIEHKMRKALHVMEEKINGVVE